MDRLAQFVVNGLAGGFVVGLLALSVVMIYRSTRVLSFAQGAIASLATYVYYQVATVWKWPVAAALLVALSASVVIGAAAERLAIRPLRGADALTRTVATLGLVLILQVVMRVVWKGTETFVTPLSSARINLLGITLAGQVALTALTAVAAAGALALWTRTTYTGLGLSAVAEDRDAARLLGVDPERASLMTWTISAVLAGLAGILVTPLLVLNPWQMTLIMITSYGAALIGGFLSLPLALAGGLVIGVVQSVTTGYVNVSGISEAFGFVAVFAVLLFSKGRRGASPALGARGW